MHICITRPSIYQASPPVKCEDCQNVAAKVRHRKKLNSWPHYHKHHSHLGDGIRSLLYRKFHWLHLVGDDVNLLQPIHPEAGEFIDKQSRKTKLVSNFSPIDSQSIGITTRKSSIDWTTHHRSIGQHSQFAIGHNGRYCAGAQSAHETMEHKQRKGMRSVDGRRSWWHKCNTNALYESTLLRFCWFGANTDPSQ